MFDMIPPGFEEQSQDASAIIDEIVQRITARGLTLPAILLLEMHKPLSTYLHSMGVLSAPILSALVGRDFVRSALYILADRARVDALIDRLENGQQSLCRAP